MSNATRPALTAANLKALYEIHSSHHADGQAQVPPAWHDFCDTLVRKGLARHTPSVVGGAYELTAAGRAHLPGLVRVRGDYAWSFAYPAA